MVGLINFGKPLLQNNEICKHIRLQNGIMQKFLWYDIQHIICQNETRYLIKHLVPFILMVFTKSESPFEIQKRKISLFWDFIYDFQKSIRVQIKGFTLVVSLIPSSLFLIVQKIEYW